MVFKDERLFHGRAILESVLENHLRRLQETVDGIARDQFLNTSEDALIEHVAGSMAIQPLELYRDRTELAESEARVDVSQYRDRDIFRDRGPTYVPGIRITVSTPYSGEPDLWQVRPSAFMMNYPHGRPERPD